MLSTISEHVNIDWVVLVVIGLAALVDTLLRGIAFRRVDSFALSMALFSTAYSAVELGAALRLDDPSTLETTRFAAAVVPLIIMIAYHFWCRDLLESQVDNLLDDRITGSTADVTSSSGLIRLSKPIVRRSILVTFVSRSSEKLRPGKKSWREDSVRLVNAFVQMADNSDNTNQDGGERGEPSSTDTTTDAGGLITETDFFLPRWIRVLGMGLFFVCAVVSFGSQVVSFV